MNHVPILRTYEIVVTEQGKGPSKEIAKAFSPQELIRQYESMGFEPNQVRILREIGAKPIQTEVRQPQPQVTNDQGPIQLMNTSDLPPEVRAEVEKNLKIQPVQQPVFQPVAPPPVQQMVVHTVQQQPVQTMYMQKPMFWKDGDTEFKLEAGQLFKKTWNKVGLKKLESDYGIKIRFKNGKNSEDKISSCDYTIEVMEWIRVEQQ